MRTSRFKGACQTPTRLLIPPQPFLLSSQYTIYRLTPTSHPSSFAHQLPPLQFHPSHLPPPISPLPSHPSPLSSHSSPLTLHLLTLALSPLPPNSDTFLSSLPSQSSPPQTTLARPPSPTTQPTSLHPHFPPNLKLPHFLSAVSTTSTISRPINGAPFSHCIALRRIRWIRIGGF